MGKCSSKLERTDTDTSFHVRSSKPRSSSTPQRASDPASTKQKGGEDVGLLESTAGPSGESSQSLGRLRKRSGKPPPAVTIQKPLEAGSSSALAIHDEGQETFHDASEELPKSPTAAEAIPLGKSPVSSRFESPIFSPSMEQGCSFSPSSAESTALELAGSQARSKARLTSSASLPGRTTQPFKGQTPAPALSASVSQKITTRGLSPPGPFVTPDDVKDALEAKKILEAKEHETMKAFVELGDNWELVTREPHVAKLHLAQQDESGEEPKPVTTQELEPRPLEVDKLEEASRSLDLDNLRTKGDDQTASVESSSAVAPVTVPAISTDRHVELDPGSLSPALILRKEGFTAREEPPSASEEAPSLSSSSAGSGEFEIIRGPEDERTPGSPSPQLSEFSCRDLDSSSEKDDDELDAALRREIFPTEVKPVSASHGTTTTQEEVPLPTTFTSKSSPLLDPTTIPQVNDNQKSIDDFPTIEIEIPLQFQTVKLEDANAKPLTSTLEEKVVPHTVPAIHSPQLIPNFQLHGKDSIFTALETDLAREVLPAVEEPVVAAPEPEVAAEEVAVATRDLELPLPEEAKEDEVAAEVAPPAVEEEVVVPPTPEEEPAPVVAEVEAVEAVAETLPATLEEEVVPAVEEPEVVPPVEVEVEEPVVADPEPEVAAEEVAVATRDLELPLRETLAATLEEEVVPAVEEPEVVPVVEVEEVAVATRDLELSSRAIEDPFLREEVKEEHGVLVHCEHIEKDDAFSSESAGEEKLVNEECLCASCLYKEFLLNELSGDDAESLSVLVSKELDNIGGIGNREVANEGMILSDVSCEKGGFEPRAPVVLHEEKAIGCEEGVCEINSTPIEKVADIVFTDSKGDIVYVDITGEIVYEDAKGGIGNIGTIEIHLDVKGEDWPATKTLASKKGGSSVGFDDKIEASYPTTEEVLLNGNSTPERNGYSNGASA